MPSNANLKLRPGTLEDIPAILQLIRKVVPLMRAAGNLQWDDEYPNAEVFTRDVALGFLWVVEAPEGIAGVTAITTDQEPEYAQVGWDITEAAIVTHRLAVDPNLRGQGIAAMLLAQADAVAVQRGIPILRIDTNTNNQATQRLFPGSATCSPERSASASREGLRFLCYEKRLP